MDRFLRAVIEKRDREQFGEHTDPARMDWLRSAVKQRHCEFCNSRLNETDGGIPYHLRRACGGKRCARLLEIREAHERQVAEEQSRRDALLALAGITHTREVEMESSSGEVRMCSKGCGKQLGANNRSGICSPCQVGMGNRVAAESKPKSSKKSEIRKRFYGLAELIGEDPDALLEDFMSGWVDRISHAAKRLRED